MVLIHEIRSSSVVGSADECASSQDVEYKTWRETEKTRRISGIVLPEPEAYRQGRRVLTVWGSLKTYHSMRWDKTEGEGPNRAA